MSVNGLTEETEEDWNRVNRVMRGELYPLSNRLELGVKDMVKKPITEEIESPAKIWIRENISYFIDGEGELSELGLAKEGYERYYMKGVTMEQCRRWAHETYEIYEGRGRVKN